MIYEMFPELLDEILRTIIQNGKGIEVNTSGIDKVGHVLPHPSIINRYRELGGNIITIGSDAHTPERVGKYIPDTIKLVRECGVEEAVCGLCRKISFPDSLLHYFSVFSKGKCSVCGLYRKTYL